MFILILCITRCKYGDEDNIICQSNLGSILRGSFIFMSKYPKNVSSSKKKGEQNKNAYNLQYKQ